MPDIASPDWNAILSGAADADGTTDSSNPFYSAVGQSAPDAGPAIAQDASQPTPDATPSPDAAPDSSVPSATPAASAPASTDDTGPSLDDMKAASTAAQGPKTQSWTGVTNSDGTPAVLEHKNDPSLDDMQKAAADARPPGTDSDYPMPKSREFANQQLAKMIQQYDAGTGMGPNQPAIMPGGEEVPNTGSPTLDQRAEAEGVSTNGASTAAQFNAEFVLGQLDPTSPDDQKQAIDAVSRAITKDTGQPFDPSRVRVGPLTKELEWQPDPAKPNEWDLFSGTGFSNALSHIVASTPDLIHGGAETVGGIAGGTAAGLGLGPYATPIGGAAGAGIARELSTYVALHSAKDRGLTSMDDDEIFGRSVKAGVHAAGTTIVGGTLFGALRRFALGIHGYDAALSNKVGSWDAIKQGLKIGAGLKDRIKSVTGQDVELPMTTGQAAGLPEATAPDTVYSHTRRDQPYQGDAARAAETALMNKSEDLRAPISDVYEKQRAALQIVQNSIFQASNPQALTRGGEAMTAAVEAEQRQAVAGTAASQANLAAGQRLAEGAERGAVRSAISDNAAEPTRAAQEARTLLKAARNEEFEPFREQYDTIQSQAGVQMNLDGFRRAAQKIQGAMTQKIVPSLNPRGASATALRQSSRAGIPPELDAYLKENAGDDEWGDLVDEIESSYEGEPQTLGDVMKLRTSLRAAARDAKLKPGHGREAVIFGDLERALQENMDSSLPPEVTDAINLTDAAYKATVSKYNYGVVSKLIKDDGRGTFAMKDNAAIDSILEGATSTDAFMSSIFSPSSFDPATGKLSTNVIPYGGQILKNVQQAVMGRIAQKFVVGRTVSGEAGKLGSVDAFEKFLSEHEEVLDRLFNLTPVQREAAPEAMAFSTNALHNAAAMARASKSAMEAVKGAAGDINSKYGIYTGSPSKIIDQVVSQGNYAALSDVRRIIVQHQGEQGGEAFTNALAAKARDMMADGNKLLSPDKVDSFLASDEGQAIGKLLGNRWSEGVKTARDLVRLIDMNASPQASQELSSVVNREHKELTGIYRGFRILVPPLSEHSRILTATLGFMNDRAKVRISQLMADPEKLDVLRQYGRATKSPFQASTRQQLGRMGFQQVLDFHDSQRAMGREIGDE